jgi:hypothetical protein
MSRSAETQRCRGEEAGKRGSEEAGRTEKRFMMTMNRYQRPHTLA